MPLAARPPKPALNAFSCWYVPIKQVLRVFMWCGFGGVTAAQYSFSIQFSMPL